MEEINLSGDDRSAFLSIFDTLCNVSYERSEIDEKLSELNSTVELRTSNISEEVRNGIQNYTEWFERKENILSAIRSLAEIINSTYSIDEIDRMLETKKLELEDMFDEKLSAWREEKKRFVLKDEFNSSLNNITAFYRFEDLCKGH
jgi:hypothetical protein